MYASHFPVRETAPTCRSGVTRGVCSFHRLSPSRALGTSLPRRRGEQRDLDRLWAVLLFSRRHCRVICGPTCCPTHLFLPVRFPAPSLSATTSVIQRLIAPCYGEGLRCYAALACTRVLSHERPHCTGLSRLLRCAAVEEHLRGGKVSARIRRSSRRCRRALALGRRKHARLCVYPGCCTLQAPPRPQRTRKRRNFRSARVAPPVSTIYKKRQGCQVTRQLRERVAMTLVPPAVRGRLSQRAAAAAAARARQLEGHRTRRGAAVAAAVAQLAHLLASPETRRR